MGVVMSGHHVHAFNAGNPAIAVPRAAPGVVLSTLVHDLYYSYSNDALGELTRLDGVDLDEAERALARALGFVHQARAARSVR